MENPWQIIPQKMVGLGIVPSQNSVMLEFVPHTGDRTFVSENFYPRKIWPYSHSHQVSSSGAIPKVGGLAEAARERRQGRPVRETL